jgi:hypothetical protein
MQSNKLPGMEQQVLPAGGAIYVRSMAVKKVKPQGLFHPTKRETEKSDITPNPADPL